MSFGTQVNRARYTGRAPAGCIETSLNEKPRAQRLACEECNGPTDLADYPVQRTFNITLSEKIEHHLHVIATTTVGRCVSLLLVVTNLLFSGTPRTTRCVKCFASPHPAEMWRKQQITFGVYVCSLNTHTRIHTHTQQSCESKKIIQTKPSTVHIDREVHKGSRFVSSA